MNVGIKKARIRVEFGCIAIELYGWSSSSEQEEYILAQGGEDGKAGKHSQGVRGCRREQDRQQSRDEEESNSLLWIPDVTPS
ncbi:hypothetical protein PV325_003055 [Microctonus aethiopoides]|nr:hypothetical protein PV325_003055 [Microctonus aethiopoides]